MVNGERRKVVWLKEGSYLEVPGIVNHSPWKMSELTTAEHPCNPQRFHYSLFTIHHSPFTIENVRINNCRKTRVTPKDFTIHYSPFTIPIFAD
jgi:hypothetical protein